MAISFNQVPRDIRVPFVYVEFDNSRAVQGPSIQPYRNLVIGQRLSTGSQAALEPVRVTSTVQAQTLFGSGSMLADMLEGLFANNKVTETWAVALDDATSSTAASGSITVGGTVTAGTVTLYIGGERISVGVSQGQTPSKVATAIAAAINDADGAVSAAVAESNNKQVTLTARHKGVCGNQIDLRHSYFDGETLPTGLTLTISSMTGGTGNPDIGTVWPVIGDTHYNVIATPYTDGASLASLETELADRFGPLRQIEALAFAGAAGSFNDLATLGATRNSPYVSIMGAGQSPTPPWVWAAAVAGLVAEHGNIDPARPFQTLPIKGVLAAKNKDRMSLRENNLLLKDGISTHAVGPDGAVTVQRLITTYQTNAQGAEDISYLDINTPLTLGYLRYDFRNLILRKYPRHKLADDGTRFGPGQAVITPKVGKAEAVARYRVWEELGLVENGDRFKDELICERNLSDPNRLDWMLPPDLVNQFRVAGAQIGFLL